jgi:hypothetical protein
MELSKMSRKIATALPVFFTCLLLTIAGCSKNSATASNFEEGLNHYYQGSPECMNTDLLTSGYGNSSKWWNELAGKLVQVGLLSKIDAGSNGAFGEFYRYEYTSAARATMPPKGSHGPCFGTKKVEKVVNFIEPGEGNGGPKQTTVTYIWKLTNVPAWAQTLAAERDQRVDALFCDSDQRCSIGMTIRGEAPEGKREVKTVLVLTHLGWRVPGDDQ